ncbi:MAG: Type 1 glutamine amidotransferase-like domain-containing protein [Lysinibacillus sp.]
MNRTIIAIAGGGFSRHIPAYIDEYIISQARSDGAVKICFVPTASNDAQGYIDRFYEAFPHCETSHITQDKLASPSMQAFLNEQDILYVGGGNTQFMLKKWREAGFDALLKNAYQQGTVLAGISAGAMCWFDVCLCELDDGSYEEVQGLGLLAGTFCPHYQEPKRKEAFDEWQTRSIIQPSYALTDDETLHFRNEALLVKLSTSSL